RTSWPARAWLTSATAPSGRGVSSVKRTRTSARVPVGAPEARANRVVELSGMGRSVAVATAARAGILAGLVNQEGREEAVLLGVFVEREGEPVAGGCALVAVGALAEATRDAGGHRVALQVGGGQPVGEELRVLRVGSQPDAVGRPVNDGSTNGLQLHLGEAEVG